MTTNETERTDPAELLDEEGQARPHGDLGGAGAALTRV